MEKERLKETYHVVAFLDLLGVSVLMSSGESEETLNRINHLFDLAKSRWVKEQGLEAFSQIKCVMFSDNILLAQPMGAVVEDGYLKADELSKIVAFISYICLFQSVALEHGLLFRGGIAFGQLYIDGAKNTVWGKALVDAHKLEEESAIYPRVVLSNAFGEYQFCMPHVRRDFDGMLFVDYLSTMSDGGKSLSSSAKKLIEKNRGQKEKIVQKYKWLEHYFGISMQ